LQLSMEDLKRWPWITMFAGFSVNTYDHAYASSRLGFVTLIHRVFLKWFPNTSERAVGRVADDQINAVT